MAVTIKLKNASGSDPNASDLVVGELAIRTDTAKLFTKKDNGSVVEILGSTGGGLTNGDKGDITVANNGDTLTVDDGVINNAKVASDAAIALSKLATGTLPSGIKVNGNNIDSGSIYNSDVNASAAIAGTKISPDFGSQNISTTGGLLIGDTSAMNANFGSTTHGVVEVAGSSGGELVLRRNDTSIGSGNSLGRIEAMGNDPNGNEERVGGVIAFSCPSGRTWNADDYPTNITFATCKDGSGTRTTSLFINSALGNKKHNVLVGGASGSNMDDYYLGIRGNENTSDSDSTNVVNFGILNQSQSASAQAHIDFRLGQASTSNTCGVRLIAGKMSGWNNTTSTRDGNFKIQVANNATLTTRFYINNAGRVGLGNIAPSETLDVTGNIAVSGTVDGRDVASDGSKLDGIESGATADQTASEIVSLLSDQNITTSGNITTTGDIKIDNISKSVQVGDITNDNYLQLIQLSNNSTKRGFTTQHSSASVFENLQGSTTQHLILGDSSNDNSGTIFGISHSQSGASHVKKLNLTGQGDLDVQRNITLGGTVDGVDIAARDTLFGGLTSSSGVLSNGVTATTQSAGDNSTKVATTAYTDTAISNLVDSSPSTLNTLNELAAALGDDANFSTTVTNSIATKMPLAGGTFTGNVLGSSGVNIKLDSNIGSNGSTAYASMAGYLEFTNDYSDAARGANKIRLQSDGNWLAGFGISANSHDIYTGGNFNFYKSNSTTSFTFLMGLSSSGNLSIAGTVDGRDVAADGTKLDGIESNATADQTASEILSLLSNQNITTSGLLNTGNATLNRADITVVTDGSRNNGVFIDAGDTGAGNRPNLVLKGAGSAALGQEAIQVYYNNGSNKTFDLDYNGNIEARNISLTAGADITGDTSCKGNILLTGDATTTNQNRTISFTGFDKEGTTDFTDNAFIRHTTNTGGLAGSVLEIGSLNDSNDGIAFHTNSHNNNLRLNGNIIWNAGNDGSGSGLDADKVDGIQASSFVRGDGVDNGATTIEVNDADFIVQDTTDSVTNFIWRDHSANKLYIGTAAHAVVTPRSSVVPQADSTYNLGANGTRWANIYADTLYGDGSNLTNLPSQTDNNFTNADHSKLDGIEANATADQTASEILTLIKTVDGSGSGLDADTIDGFTSSKLYRQVDSASATVGAGWMTVAENTNGRYHGEIFVSDSSSGDHAFIRIDWMRSYMDSCFTVINCGGHGNRITGVRVLRDSDDVYGNKKLQVYVTTNSPYRVQINRLQNQTGWGSHTVVTPVIQASISGYQVDGSSLENLNTYNFSAEQGIQVGSGGMKSGGNVILNDNIKALFGTGSDLEIYHNGSQSYLNSTNGAIELRHTVGGANEALAKFNPNGSVQLFNNGSAKLETSGSGVSVTGSIVVSGTVDGRDVATDGTKLDGIEANATADQSASEILTLIKTVDGVGSGLDADTLDGISSASFLRSDANDNVGATLTFTGSAGSNGLDLATNDVYASFRVFRNNQSGGDGMYIGYSNANNGITRIYGGGAISGGLDVRGSGVNDVKINGNTVFHAGNDGSGSGLDSDTVDGIQASSFLRSDAADTFSGDLTSSGSARILLKKTDNNVSDHIQFYNGTTRIGEIGCEDGTWLRINQETNKNIYTPRYIRADAGFFVDGTSKGIDGSGNFIGGTIAGASDYGTLVRSNASDTLTGGTYTFNSATDQRIILQGATNPYIRFQEGTTNKGYIQWNSAGYLRLVNQEDSSQLRVQDDIKFSQDGSTFYSLWHSGNDGSGSGLDADKLDGIQASSFLRSDAADTASAKLTVRDIQIQAGYHLQRSDHHTGHLEGSYNNIGNNSTKTNPIYSIGSNYNPNDDSLNNFYGIGFTHATNASFISKTGAGNWGLYVAADGDARVWLGGDNGVVSSSGQHYVGSNVVWNAGNDGSGSGLDADTLDGVQGSNFLRSNTADTASGDITFSGGAGAVTIAANSDIRLNVGTWTGETSCKIQHHSNRLYLQYPDAGSLICRDSAGNNNLTLDSSGNLTAVGDVTAYSDINLKTNIKTIDNALNMCNQMRGVFFDWKASGDSSIGVIAQEIEKVIPQIVHTNENTDPLTGVVETIKSVDYGKVTSVLINAINELTQKVKELENKLNVE